MRANVFGVIAALLIGTATEGVTQTPPTGRIIGICRIGAAQAPLGGATVQLVGTSYSTVTDHDGHFFLGPVPPGQYVLEAREIGYVPNRRTIQVGPTGAINIALEMVEQRGDTLMRTPVELEAITITAAPATRENPATTITVPPLVITQTPALNTYDLLRQTAGIEVHQQGQGPGFASDASMRGFSSDHSTDMALWVDGVPINEPVNGHAEGYNDWSLVFPQAIEAVDVIKGPTSPVYGNFAMAGAINMRTLDHVHGLGVWGSGGAYDRFEGAELTGWQNPRNHGVLGIRGESQGGWRPNSQYKIGQFHGRLVQDFSSSASLDAGVELYGTDWHSPGFLSARQFQARDYDFVANPTDGGFKRRAQERVSFRLARGDSFLWRTTTYATQGRWQLYLTTPPEGGLSEGSGSQTEEEDLRHGWGGTSAATFRLPHAEVTIGTEGRWDQSDYQNWYVTNRVRDSSQVLVSARQAYGALFLATTEDIGSRLRLNLGARLDGRNTQATPPGQGSTSASAGVVSPKLGALYHLPVAGDLYVNVSRGFKQTDGVIADPTLPFITEWAYEGGFKLEARRVSGSVALFRTDVSNEQTFDPITLTSVHGGASRRQGVEVQLRASVTNAVQLSSDWTFQDAKYQRLVTQDGDTLDGARVFNTAKYVGTVSLGVAPPSAPWEIRASTNIEGPYSPFDEPGVELPTYALFHLTAGLHVGAALLQVGARNLFDKAYPELRAGGSVSPGQPRTIYADIRYLL